MPDATRGIATALVQPEYFPGLDVVAASLVADRILVGDTFQYSRQSFHNRCALRTPDGRQWLTVPVRGGQHGASLIETRIDNRRPWWKRHWKTMAFNYGTAPYFEHYADDIRAILFAEYATVAEVTTVATQRLAELCGSTARWDTLSALGGPGGWDGWPQRFGIADGLVVRRQSPPTHGNWRAVPELDLKYRQNFAGFEGGLSALDLLFNAGPESGDLIRACLTRMARRQS